MVWHQYFTEILLQLTTARVKASSTLSLVNTYILAYAWPYVTAYLSVIFTLGNWDAEIPNITSLSGYFLHSSCNIDVQYILLKNTL